VLAALSDGRVVELSIDSNDADGFSRQWTRIHKVQSSMSNFLSEIGQTDKSLTRLKQELEAEDSVLQQLAIAGSLLRNHSNSFIACSVVASVDNTSLLPCRRIDASLSNRATFTLGHNWTFLMSVLPSGDCCGCKDGVTDQSRCQSCRADGRCLYASCNISDMSPGTSASLSLLIKQGENLSVQVSYTVEMAFIYTPESRLDATVKHVLVPLATRVVDMLDFAQLPSSITELRHLSGGGSFVSDCHRLQRLCRPNVTDDHDSKSVDKLETNTVSAAEHVISISVAKSTNMQGTISCSGLIIVTKIL